MHAGYTVGFLLIALYFSTSDGKQPIVPENTEQSVSTSSRPSALSSYAYLHFRRTFMLIT
jgi:hypothetical protein